MAEPLAARCRELRHAARPGASLPAAARDGGQGSGLGSYCRQAQPLAPYARRPGALLALCRFHLRLWLAAEPGDSLDHQGTPIRLPRLHRYRDNAGRLAARIAAAEHLAALAAATFPIHR